MSCPKVQRFTAPTRISGIDMDERQICKGAVGAIRGVHPFDPDAGRKLR